MDELPYVAEHMQQHVTGFGKGTSQFEFGLDLLLDGLARMRDAAAVPPSPARRRTNGSAR